MNKLAEAYRSGLAESQAEEGLAFLIRYTAEHFQAEEQYLRQMGYPKLGPHMVHHPALMGKAHDLQAKHEQGAPTTMEVTIFLADWLKHHIDEVDMEYMAFAKAKIGSSKLANDRS